MGWQATRWRLTRGSRRRQCSSPRRHSNFVRMYQRVFAQETFAARRRRVAERIGTRAVAVIQGARQPGTHDQFRQSNELFYLCGVEVPHAYLVIDGGDSSAALFLPHQDRHSVEAEGEHLSAANAERARELTGVDRVAALAALPAALRGAAAIFTPLSPAEGARSSWDTLRRAQEEAEADPFDGGPAREAAFAGLLRQRCPAARIEDLSPVLDEMRLVKDEQEVAVLREAGAICADALTACMRATAPGVMEYQLAGVLEYRYRVSGARGAGPIIRSSRAAPTPGTGTTTPTTRRWPTATWCWWTAPPTCTTTPPTSPACGR